MEDFTNANTTSLPIGKLYSTVTNFFFQGPKLNVTQRGIRLGISLAEPILSLTGILNGVWETTFELVSLFMIITSFTGVCFAGKIWAPLQILSFARFFKNQN